MKPGKRTLVKSQVYLAGVVSSNSGNLACEFRRTLAKTTACKARWLVRRQLAQSTRFSERFSLEAYFGPYVDYQMWPMPKVPAAFR